MVSMSFKVSLLMAIASFLAIDGFRMQQGFHASTRGSVTMAVAAKSLYKVTLLPGDGIGPEIIQATLPVLETVAKKFDFKFQFKEADIGGIAIDRHNDPYPDSSYQECINADSVLLASIGGYKWDNNPRNLRPETGLLKMRKQMDLFANLRPAKVIPQLIDASTLKKEVIEGVDIMVVRELTGGIYFGTPKGIETVNGVRRGFSTGAYTEPEIDRIARVAFEIAQKRRKKVMSVDKANVLDVSQLWREVVINTAKQYPDIELQHMYIDNCAMQLIRNPRQFDVIVCGNMFGDILSDEASMLVGSLGMLPSASLGDSSRPGVFEPCHGSAPDIAGQDKANPLAQILSAAMMLRYDLSQPKAADMIELAVEKVLDAGYRTGDIHQDGMKRVGCRQMGDEVAEAIQQL
jgi:3-isopropylmalate dehydrogenase